MHTVLVRFGGHVESLRQSRDLSIDDLAIRIGISAEEMIAIEAGAFAVDVPLLSRIAIGLDQTASQLLEGL